MNLRKKLLATVAAVVLTASTALTGVSQSASDTSSVTIYQGNFSVSLSAANFNNVQYSLDQQLAENGSIDLNVNDSRGTGAGWKVPLSITDFIGETNNSQIIPVAGLEIDPASITVTTALPNSQPVVPEMTPVYNEAAPQLTWSAPAGQGQGSYNLHMESDLIIPGRTQAQTYTATGTVNVVTAP